MTHQNVAIITGASRGIGAGLVKAYRELGYAVVANSRSIEQSDDPLVAAVSGDTPPTNMPTCSPSTSAASSS